MAVTFPQIGNKVVAKIVEKQGDCTIGMDIGDEFLDKLLVFLSLDPSILYPQVKWISQKFFIVSTNIQCNR